MQMLIIRESGAPDRAFDLFGEDVLVGRSRRCDLRLANVSVSREHARLRWKQGAYLVEDLGSHNGVFVNDKRVGEQMLSSGDRVRLGKYSLVYIHGDLPRKLRHMKPEGIPRWLSITVATANDETFHMSVAQMRRLAISRGLLEGGVLVSREDPPQRWHLGEGEWTLGRSGLIPISGLWTAGQSAVIQWNGGNHVIQRTGGLARIRINGRATRLAILEEGDEIQIGQSAFVYEIAD